MIRLWWCLLRCSADLIIAIDFEAGFPAAVANLFTHVPFIYDCLDNYPMRYSLPTVIVTVLKMLHAWVMKRAVEIIVADENRITATEKPYVNKLSVIYSCPPDIPSPPEDKQKRSPFTVYVNGYLRRDRGIKELLEAGKYIPEMRILMAGQFVEPEVEEEALRNPQVDFRGWLSYEEGLKLYYEADVVYAFYDPSREIYRRASSNKWFDAMMTGKPILVNSELLRSEWIAGQDIGYLCQYGDVQGLRRMLQHIRDHPADAFAKGKRGRFLYEENFNWRLMEEKLQQVIARAASRVETRK
jgi:glycosyltransferase involved in cell wall biosynthesis